MSVERGTLLVRQARHVNATRGRAPRDQHRARVSCFARVCVRARVPTFSSCEQDYLGLKAGAGVLGQKWDGRLSARGERAQTQRHRVWQGREDVTESRMRNATHTLYAQARMYLGVR